MNVAPKVLNLARQMHMDFRNTGVLPTENAMALAYAADRLDNYTTTFTTESFVDGDNFGYRWEHQQSITGTIESGTQSETNTYFDLKSSEVNTEQTDFRFMQPDYVRGLTVSANSDGIIENWYIIDRKNTALSQQGTIRIPAGNLTQS